MQEIGHQYCEAASAGCSSELCIPHLIRSIILLIGLELALGLDLGGLQEL